MADRIYPSRHPAWRPILILLLLLALPAPGGRADVEVREPVPRRILALVDSGPRGWATDSEDPVQQLFELPLNHLGMTVLRHDVRKGPPPARSLEGVRAVLTVFEYTEEPVEWLWPWLEERRVEGLKFVHLRELGPLELDPPRLARWLESFGLGWDDGYHEVPLGVTAEFPVPERTSLENEPRGVFIHRGPWTRDEAIDAWVRTRCPTRESRVRTPVVTGAFGGIALDPWCVRETSADGSRRWRFDPYEFFLAALDLQGVPAPHPSVLNGRRMFFCHVDGDGFESGSLVRTGRLCGDVFRTDIVERFELPFTLSVIIASLTPSIAPDSPTPAMVEAKRLLMHPRVEAATHTVLHPFSWQSAPGRPFPLAAGFPGLEGYESSAVAEVRESVRFIDEQLLEDGKRCRVVLWSGNACPPAEAIRAADELGCLNVNGGVYRYDRLYDSVAYVAPLGRVTDGVAQIYCGAPNENIYPGYFETQPGSFRHVEEVIERTGGDRILKPANIYVHFYSVEHPTRFRVFADLLQRWGIEEETAPVFASTFSAAARDALLSARVLRREDGWELRDFGECRTARIDGETPPVDWDRSPGILGARRIGDSLYLHLGAPDARVTFAAGAAPRLHLLQANHVLADVERDPDRIAATSESVARRFLEFAGLPAGGEAEVRVDGEGEARTADEKGRIRLELPPGRSRIEVRIP